MVSRCLGGPCDHRALTLFLWALTEAYRTVPLKPATVLGWTRHEAELVPQKQPNKQNDSRQLWGFYFCDQHKFEIYSRNLISNLTSSQQLGGASSSIQHKTPTWTEASAKQRHNKQTHRNIWVSTAETVHTQLWVIVSSLKPMETSGASQQNSIGLFWVVFYASTGSMVV